MQLKKNQPKSLSSFVFPDDANIDVRESAIRMLKDETYFENVKSVLIAMKENELESQKEDSSKLEAYKQSLSREEIESKFADQATIQTIYNAYVSKKYNHEVLAGDPVIFHFDTVNVSDLNILKDKFPMLKEIMLKAKNMKSSNDEESLELISQLLTDEKIKSSLLDLLKTFLNAKLDSFQNFEGSKEELVNVLCQEENLTIQNLKALVQFIKSLYEGNVVKKKILKS